MGSLKKAAQSGDGDRMRGRRDGWGNTRGLENIEGKARRGGKRTLKWRKGSVEIQTLRCWEKGPLTIKRQKKSGANLWRELKNAASCPWRLLNASGEKGVEHHGGGKRGAGKA